MFADKPIMRSPQPSANQTTMGSVNAKRGGSQSGAVSVM
jgi:alpha-D-ribose 1-methylphosphonate 5-triphosphate diphosphatase PhnM